MTNTTEVSTTSKVVENPMITVEGFKLKKFSIISTFSDTVKIDKAVAKFAKDALSVVPDLTSKKGRDAIASVAFKISKKKTSIVSKMIDPSIEDAKALVKNVNAGKTYFKNKMDDLRDEVRAPLNEWEAAEKIREEKRINDIQVKIKGIHLIINFAPGKKPCKDEITELMEAVDCINCEEGFAEFTQDALQAKSSVKEKLTEMLNVIIQKEITDKAEADLLVQEQKLASERLKIKAQERLNKLMMIPTTMFGKTSEEIESMIFKVEHTPIIEEEFGEFVQQANESVVTVVHQLGTMLDQVKFMEEQAKPEVTQQQAQSDHEENLQEQRPEFCGREFTGNEPLQPLPTSAKSPVIGNHAVNNQGSAKEVKQRLAETFANVGGKKMFQVQVEWSGYSRGYSVYEVEAENEEEALECYYEGNQLERCVVRDDTEVQEKNIIK